MAMRVTGKPQATWADVRLVRECLSGNRDAWSALIEKYKALIYSIPIKYGFLQQDAADIFQATCLELLARLPELRQPRALPKCLIPVAHHECYRWKRSQQLVSGDAEPELPDPEVLAIAESLVEQPQEEQILREAVRLPSPQCQRLVVLLFFETPPRPYAEVAKELGRLGARLDWIYSREMSRAPAPPAQ
jgi:RNA polymerase sigma factor (sigma-70 family)